MKRVALPQAFEGEPGGLKYSVFLKRFHGILRAGGGKAAALPKKRAKAKLIKADKADRKPFHPSSLANAFN